MHKKYTRLQDHILNILRDTDVIMFPAFNKLLNAECDNISKKH